MKLPNVRLMVAWLVLVFGVAGVQAREFTSKNGSVMQAELLSHKDGKVMLRRADGKEFEVDPSIFAAADEQFIRQWMKTRAELIEYKLEVDVDKKKIEKTSSGYAAYWAYEIEISNKGQDTIPYLNVQYRVIYNNYDKRLIEGDAVMDQPLDFNRSLVVTTKPAYIYTGYRDHGLVGCLVRILDRKGNVILDWVSSETAMKGVTWENSKGGRATTTTIIR